MIYFICNRLTIPSNTPWLQLATRLAKLTCVSSSTAIHLTLCGDELEPLSKRLWGITVEPMMKDIPRKLTDPINVNAYFYL